MQSIILGEYGNNSLFIIAIAYAFVLAMAQFTFAYYRGTGNFKWYNGTQLTVQTAIILPLILFPFLTTKIVFTAWLIITAILVTIYIGREFAIKRMPHVTLTEVKSELNTVIRYSSGRLVADFFLFSLSAFPLIYISNSLGLQPTAYFSVGITFVTMVTPLYSFMGIILLPYVSESLANKDLQRANIFINKLTLAYLLSAIAIIAFIYVFINFLTSFFFSESYLMTSDLSRIMILSVLPQAIYLLYRNPIDAISVIPYNTIILGISLIAMILAFSHFSSLVQLAWSYVAVSLLQGVLSWITWHIIKKPYQA
jgi:O-antigen/teichoic acid export membrane protein